jgi:hypothetical protein
VAAERHAGLKVGRGGGSSVELVAVAGHDESIARMVLVRDEDEAHGGKNASMGGGSEPDQA